MTDELTDRERAILDFEGRWWKYEGPKNEAIREALGMAAGDYYQVLNALLDREAALAYRADVVWRLRRMRESEGKRRDVRRLDVPPTLPAILQRVAAARAATELRGEGNTVRMLPIW